jgi:uncharacterized protein involved in outer membrane biogenesis
LVRRTLVIASAEIDRPEVRVIATKDGRENYDLSSASPAPIGTLSILSGHARVSLASLDADFEVTFGTEEHEAGRADATRFAAEARGSYASEPVTARFVIDLPSNVRDPSRDWPIDITVQNGPTRASAKGTLQDPFDRRRAIVDFQIAGPDMARFMPLTGVPFPVTPPYDLGGTLHFAAGTYRVTDAKGRVGRSEVEGTMTVATPPGRRTEITTELVSRSVDLGDITSLLSGKPGKPGTPGQTPQQQVQAERTQRKEVASPRILPQAPLPIEKFDWTDLHLAFRAQRIQGASMPFDNLVLGMDVVDGVVAVRQISFGIGPGRISGDVRLTPRADGAIEAHVGIRFERADVARLLWASGHYEGHGALNGSVRVDGTGRSIAEILAGADGAASLWMLGGDLSSLLVDLAGLRLGSALLSTLSGSPTTKVDCFLADLALRRGILSTRKLLLETADAVTEGRGAVDLRQERVEIGLRTQSRHLTVGVLPAPLLISGTLKEPRATPVREGGLAGALAALPTIQLGLADAPRCKGLLSQARKED